MEKQDFPNSKIKLVCILNRWSSRGAQFQLENFLRCLQTGILPEIYVIHPPINKEDIREHIPGSPQIKFRYGSGATRIHRYLELFVRLNRDRYDIVLTMGLGASLFFGRLFALVNQCRVVYSTLHTVENLHGKRSHYFDRLNRLLNTWIVKHVAKRSVRFLPNSRKLCAVVKKEVNYPTSVLYNGYPSSDFAVSGYHVNMLFPALSKVLLQKKVVMQVGALEKEKNHHFALKCFKELRSVCEDAHLVLVGDGSLRKELEAWVADHQLSKSITFAGSMGRTDVLELYRYADLAILTSQTESFPNVVAEAMGNGKPVVAVDVGGISEIIIDGSTGYVVPPGSEGAFVDKCLMILQNETLAERMGKEARRELFKRFSMEAKVDKFVDLLSKDMDLLDTQKSAAGAVRTSNRIPGQR